MGATKPIKVQNKVLLLNYIESKHPKKSFKNNEETKPRSGLTWSFWKKHTFEFFKTTGLHGYKYIAMKELSFCERLCWGIAVFVCLITSFTLIWATWQWNSQNTTIEALFLIESTHHSIWKFPFPAVTICNINKASREKAMKFAEELKDRNGLTEEEIELGFKNIAVLFGRQSVPNNMNEKMIKFQEMLDLNDINITTLITIVNPSCSDLFKKCSWRGIPTNCNELFKPTLAIEGFCCSFNYFARLKTNTFSHTNTASTPKKVAGCGAKSGLTVLIKVDSINYFSSLFGTYGIRVYVHESYDFPDENSSTKLVVENSETYIALSPEMTYSTTGLKRYSPEKRNCNLRNEGSPYFFTDYSYNNCQSECKSDDMFASCGCIPFYLPNNGTKRMCDFRDIKCVYLNRGAITTSNSTTNSTICNCLPDCDHISYPVELSSGFLIAKSTFNSDSLLKDMELTNHTLIHVYYNDLLGTLYRRDVYMSWHNLLASVGGLLGLFVGFSFVSGFEMVYFFTIRLFFDLVHSRPKKPTVSKINLKKKIDWTESNIDNFHYGISIISKNDPVSLKKWKNGTQLTKLSE